LDFEYSKFKAGCKILTTGALNGNEFPATGQIRPQVINFDAIFVKLDGTSNLPIAVGTVANLTIENGKRVLLGLTVCFFDRRLGMNYDT
jgi:hypothetical protein